MEEMNTENVTSILSINCLPDEVLKHVFSFINAEEVLTNIAHTCLRWSRISGEKDLRMKLTYSPDSIRCDCEVRAFIKNAPELRHFIFKQRRNFDSIVDLICERCPDVRSIVTKCKTGIRGKKIMKSLNRYPQIARLETCIKDSAISEDFARLHGKAHVDSTCYNFVDVNQLSDLQMLHQENKHDLKSLVIACDVSDQIISRISEFKKLEYLSLYNKDIAERSLDITKFILLKNLQTLQILEFPDYPKPCPQTKFNDVEVFPNLTKLEIIDGGSVLELHLGSILKRCPKLQHLNVQDNLLTLEHLKNIQFCPDLEYIDVSGNFSLGDEFLGIIGYSCRKLHFLDVSSCLNVTDRFVLLLHGCQGLSTIIIEGRDLIGEHFHLIPSLYPKLTLLDVRHFSNHRILWNLQISHTVLKIEQCSVDPNDCDGH